MAKNIKEGNKDGRPTKYKEELNETVYKLCLLGLTDNELADFLEIDVSTLNRWKLEYPNFKESIKSGKEIADSKVVAKLYERAIGYEHDEDKIFNNNGEPLVVPTKKHYPPDPTAAIFWLKNRQPSKWRDKQEQEISVGQNTELVIKGQKFADKD